MILKQQLIQYSVIRVENNKKYNRHDRSAKNSGKIIDRPKEGSPSPFTIQNNRQS